MAPGATMRIGKAKLSRRGLPAWLALSIAPPAVALPFAFVFVFVHSLFPGAGTQPLPYLLMSIGFGIAVSLVALTAAWSVGLAWHILALRRGWRRVLTYVLPGAALGAALSALAAAAFADIAGSLDEFGAVIRVLTLVWFGAWGALLGAATAWLIWLMRRPDRDVAPDIAAEFE